MLRGFTVDANDDGTEGQCGYGTVNEHLSCRAGFRVALTAKNRTPAEKVIKIDGVWLHGHARAGEPLH